MRQFRKDVAPKPVYRVAIVADVVAAHARRGGSVVLTSHLPVPIEAPLPTVVQLHEPAMA